MNFKYLHLVIYLSYDCNLRCSYCVMNFNKFIITNKTLDLIIEFIFKYSNNYNKIFVEFIGGEPLLQTKKIKYILSNNFSSNIKFQITTNGTIINKKIYNEIISKIDIINLSYNENYFNNNKLFSNISSNIHNKEKININFIYDPRKNINDIKKNFLFIIKNGYKNINILPIILVYNYNKKDLINLINFIIFCINLKEKFKIIFLYYIQEKNNHFEFTIDPKGNILGDNMGTAEDFFGLNNKTNNIIGKIGKLDAEEIIFKLKNYSYIKYLKNMTKDGKVKQKYKNLLLLSLLLKKYNDKISFRNGIHE